jgi:hypothetical protein
MTGGFAVRIRGRIFRGKTALPTGILKKGEKTPPKGDFHV